MGGDAIGQAGRFVALRCRWWASAVCCVHGAFTFLFPLFLSAARNALARVFLSTSPVKGLHNSKAFGKKIRSPTPAAIAAAAEKRRGRFFFQNPQGPGLLIWRAYQKFAVRKCRERRLKKDFNKRSGERRKQGVAAVNSAATANNKECAVAGFCR